MKSRFRNAGLVGYRPMRKAAIAINGLRLAVLTDFSVAYKLFASVFMMAGFFYYRQWLDFSLVLLATGLVITSEMMNTAIEALCDFVEAEYDARIGLIKDVSAGAAGVSIFIWFVVILIEIYRAYSLLDDKVW